MTKNISPVSVWYNGQNVNALSISMRGVFDDLSTNAVYYYELRGADNVLVSGNLTLADADYQNRTNNAYVLDWIAEQLGLTYTQ